MSRVKEPALADGRSVIDIVIGDGRSLFVDLLSSLLDERGYGSIVSVADARELLTAVEHRRPDLCLVDHRSLPGGGREHLLRELRVAASEHTKIVVMSRGPTPVEGATAESLDVDGLFDKRARLQSLLDGLDAVLVGECVTVASSAAEPPPREDGAWVRYLAGGLTPRERECLALLVEGRTTEQIQYTLSVSVMTVRSHIRSVLRKLGAHSRLEAASLAVRHELLTEDVVAPRAG
jgi:two-component system, NarL family, nitrate/nitrite response regulator NarL